MNTKYCRFFILFLFSLVIPLHSLAAYQYTYTKTAPYDVYSNSFPANNSDTGFDEPQDHITSDDSFRLVITSNQLLPVGATTQEYLAMAIFDFSFGNYSSLRASQPIDPEIPVYFDYIVTSSLQLFSVDSAGLPTEWDFSVEENLYGDSYGEAKLYRTATFSWGEYGQWPHPVMFYDDHNYGRLGGRVEAISYSQGVWSLNEVSSPVPENNTVAMMVFGLGLLGFVSRRINKKNQ